MKNGGSVVHLKESPPRGKRSMNMQHQFREAKNPMFNDNKLKLGTFGTNCSNACAITLAETTFELTF
jgi:hypothetical protein